MAKLRKAVRRRAVVSAERRAAMDAVTRKLCALLDRDDVELQCSAARVLGELGSAGR